MFMGNVNPHAIKGLSTLKANGFSNSKKVIKLFIEFIKNISIALRFKQGNINHFFKSIIMFLLIFFKVLFPGLA